MTEDEVCPACGCIVGAGCPQSTEEDRISYLARHPDVLRDTVDDLLEELEHLEAHTPLPSGPWLEENFKSLAIEEDVRDIRSPSAVLLPLNVIVLEAVIKEMKKAIQ